MQGKSLACLMLTLGVLASPGTLSAAEAPAGNSAEPAGSLGRQMGRFDRLKALDTDRDGAVSAEEFAKGWQERFARRDANKDGRLAPEEVALSRARGARPEERADRLVKRHDADADGRVTKEEFLAGTRKWFAGRDKDGNGVVSSAEAPRRFQRRGGARSGAETLESALARAALRFERLDANTDGVFDAAEIVAAEGERRAYRIRRAMHRMDEDRDGTVTPEEFMAPVKSRFGMLDLDSDGRITAADLPPDVRANWTRP